MIGRRSQHTPEWAREIMARVVASRSGFRMPSRREVDAASEVLAREQIKQHGGFRIVAPQHDPGMQCEAAYDAGGFNAHCVKQKGHGGTHVSAMHAGDGTVLEWEDAAQE